MNIFVYVLESETHKRRYVGITEDLTKRVKEHNSGKSKSTAPYRPWKLIYQEAFPDYKKARIREKWLKSGVGRDYLNKILDP
ncbi:MAG: GIY-YIG nuclease family protein [Cytophagales bacterium]